MIDLDTSQKTELADTFGMLSDPTRLAIVLTCLDQEHSAGDITTKLDVSQSLVSHHLRLLRAARMLRSERRGKKIFYEMADDCVRDVLKIMINHMFIHEHHDLETPIEGEN
jgi:DNA-binding transcriptional ArsR family regulator